MHNYYNALIKWPFILTSFKIQISNNKSKLFYRKRESIHEYYLTRYYIKLHLQLNSSTLVHSIRFAYLILLQIIGLTDYSHTAHTLFPDNTIYCVDQMYIQQKHYYIYRTTDFPYLVKQTMYVYIKVVLKYHVFKGLRKSCLQYTVAIFIFLYFVLEIYG